MPSATRYPLTEDLNLEARFSKEFSARSAQILTRWTYYDGNHKAPLKPQKDNYDDNIILNHIGPLADKIASFLVGDGIRFEAEDETLQEFIDDFAEQNRMEWFSNEIALTGAIEGHCAVRVIPSTEAGKSPKLTRISQTQFSVFWDVFDVSNVLWYRLQHKVGDTGKRIDYVKGRPASQTEFDHETLGWTEFVYLLDKSGKWKLSSQEAWEYEFPPVIDWPNIPNPNGYYGKSDVEGALKLNDSLNFLLSNMQRIIKHYAAPKTVGIGFKSGDLLGTEVGGFFTVNKPKSEVDIFNLEMDSDLQSSMVLAGKLVEAIWQSGGMIDPQSLKDKAGALTNFGLQVLYSDTIKRTERKRIIYGEGLIMLLRAVLELAGQMLDSPTITVVWPEVLPTDTEVQVNDLTTELAAGIISKETYRERRGYNNDREQDRLNQELQAGDVGTGILSLLNSSPSFNRGA